MSVNREEWCPSAETLVSAYREYPLSADTQALLAGLVDECHLFLNPIIVGDGKPALPRKARSRLELLDEGRFGNGVVHLHYRVTI